MADSKITALTAISTVDPTADPLVIVDVSDTSMAASGTTKKSTINQLLGSGGTATLASATITGDLTVRTNQLIANANGVGVGTTPSAWSGIGPALQVEQASLLSEASNQLYLTANGYFAGGQWNYINNASADQYYQIAGSHVWRSGIGGAGGTAIGWSTLMTLNSTGLGVGVVPSAGKGALQLSSGINFPATQVASSDANTLDDYEEGTWTPVVIGTTTSGVGIYTNQVGFYTKIGNLVTVQAYITWTAHTATGNMRLSGLPFANSNTAGSFSSVCFGYVNNLALTAGNILTGFTSVGNTFIDCFQTPVGGGASTSVPIDTAAELIYTVTYRV